MLNLLRSARSQCRRSVLLLQTTAAFFLISASVPGADAQTRSDSGGRWWPESVEKALVQAGTNRTTWEGALSSVPQAQREGLTFLLENMPQRDLQRLDANLVMENLALAYRAASEAAWAKEIPAEIFLNDVLPYANLNEHRENWRKVLYEKCAPLVKDCQTPGAAAQRLNEQLFKLVNVRYSTQRRRADQSPLESMESGLASCTGLSILLVDACRSVGVPARVAGIPNWVDKRGNHTWVEVWDHGWHFTGAAEPDPKGLDHTWFQADAAQAIKDSREHAIYAASFKRTPLAFPLVWARGLDYVSAENVTDRYAAPGPKVDPDKTRLRVNVFEHRGGARVVAKIAVTDAQDADVRFEGTTKDEKADTNDMLSFLVPRNHRFRIQVEYNGHSLQRDYASESKANDTLDVYLNDSGSAAAPTASQACAVPPADSLSEAQQHQLAPALEKFFAAKPEEQAQWHFEAEQEQLLREHESAVRRLAWQAYCAAPIHQDLKADFLTNQVRFQQYLSPYTVKKVGEKPTNGWALFIAMHGGGNAPKSLNDSQWRVMQRYYHDQTSVPGYLYVALRAPNDTWNGFYDDYVYPLIGNLIRQFLVFGEVDPNKVFIMGYSHGGYGAFAIGPKMPDHFAAIHSSAAAPTDNESSPKTLRNTVFTYMIGGNDNAYGRLMRCTNFNSAIQKLRGDRTDIYPVTMELKPGFGHPGLPDKDKIKDMYPAVRNPVPRELTWEMTDTVIHDFYWLEVAKPAKREELDATCKDNTITVTSKDVGAASILLDSRLVDFQRPIKLEADGQFSTQTVQPSLRTLCQTMAERGDPDLAFCAKIDVQLSPGTAQSQ